MGLQSASAVPGLRPGDIQVLMATHVSLSSVLEKFQISIKPLFKFYLWSPVDYNNKR